MKLPIYQSAEHVLPKLTPEAQANYGLLFERFFDGYNLTDFKNIKPQDKAKKDFISGIAKYACGNQKALGAAKKRQQSLCRATSGDFQYYKLTGHFVTGMGNSHPVENGFLWHYTLGTPYLAGSQVKGLLRGVIEQYFAEQDKAELLYKWFGSDAKDSTKAKYASQAGELIFFDAIPIKPPSLSVDIMTPHMKDWYAEGGKITDCSKASNQLPADWHEPVPVPFLACKDATFIFSIGKRAGSEIDIAEVFYCLEQALDLMGAGAKTQTGYGYMQLAKQLLANDKYDIEAAEQQAKQVQQDAAFQQQIAAESELKRELLTAIRDNEWGEKNDVAKGSFTAAINDWLDKLAANKAEQDCIAKFIEIANIHYAAQIKNPDNKKVKPHQKAWILRMLELTK